MLSPSLPRSVRCHCATHKGRDGGADAGNAWGAGRSASAGPGRKRPRSGEGGGGGGGSSGNGSGGGRGNENIERLFERCLVPCACYWWLWERYALWKVQNLWTIDMNKRAPCFVQHTLCCAM